MAPSATLFIIDEEIPCVCNPADQVEITQYADEPNRFWLLVRESGADAGIALDVNGALKLAESLAQFLRSQVPDDT